MPPTDDHNTEDSLQAPIAGDPLDAARQTSGKYALDEEARENLVGFFALLLEVRRRIDGDESH